MPKTITKTTLNTIIKILHRTTVLDIIVETNTIISYAETGNNETIVNTVGITVATLITGLCLMMGVRYIWVEPGMDKAKEIGKELIDKAGDTGERLIVRIDRSGKEIIDKADNVGKKLIDKVDEKVSDQVETVKIVIENGEEKLERLANKMSETMDKFNPVSQARTFGESAMVFLKKTARKFMKALPDSETEMRTALERLEETGNPEIAFRDIAPEVIDERLDSYEMIPSPTASSGGDGGPAAHSVMEPHIWDTLTMWSYEGLELLIYWSCLGACCIIICSCLYHWIRYVTRLQKNKKNKLGT